MDRYFSWFTESSFTLFSYSHLMALSLVGICIIGMFLSRKILRNKLPNFVIRLMIACLLLLSEISFHAWFAYYKEWSITTTLPLQLSSISLFLAIALVLTKNKTLLPITYFAGSASALLAMITPDLGPYDFPHFRFFHFFVAHGGIVLATWFMITVEKVFPSYRSLWISFAGLNIYVLLLFPLNLTLGSNYMFLMKEPASQTLISYLGPWPFYLLSLEVITIVVFHLLYLPFHFLLRRFHHSPPFNNREIRKRTL
ncbi:TIGR02206 family membrane protein [Pseudalkalibacillus hwajinpoensis]|uniref:YwaF family protein n=1 Tax=Guptibacillus hwajinpoensis TaxID=208199 RepID=UPI001CFC8D10|nr:TIGR02206 family membrane protein [Pseudalkalibacillus hwajinpoensis]